MKPSKSNLWISVHQAAGLSDHHHQRDYGDDWHFSEEEPCLWPLEFYDDYPEDGVIQMFKQLNQFIRTDHEAQQFDGEKVSVNLDLPEGIDYEQAKAIFLSQGFNVPTIANWFSGKEVLTISWVNHVVPEDEEHLLEKPFVRAWNKTTDPDM